MTLTQTIMCRTQEIGTPMYFHREAVKKHIYVYVYYIHISYKNEHFLLTVKRYLSIKKASLF